MCKSVNIFVFQSCQCCPRSLKLLYWDKLHMKWGVVAERSSLPDSSSGVSSRMWVRILVVTLVSLSKTLNHNCFVLRMGRKAVGPVCCVMHVKEPRTLIVKEKGLAPVFLEWQLNAPKLFAPRNRFLHLDRWRIINALLHYIHVHELIMVQNFGKGGKINFSVKTLIPWQVLEYKAHKRTPHQMTSIYI